MTESLLETICTNDTSQTESGPLEQKTELARDQVSLLLTILSSHKQTKYDNLARLYGDLFKIDKWQEERPLPDRHKQDQVWLNLTDHKLRLYDSIRRELKDHDKLVSSVLSDLVHGLIGYKKVKQKELLLGSLTPTEPGANPTSQYNGPTY